jgi:hypothetical protein
MINFQSDLNSVTLKLKSLEIAFQKYPDGFTYISRVLEFVQDTTLQNGLLDTISLVLNGTSTDIEEGRKRLFCHLYNITEYIITFKHEEQIRILTAYLDIMQYVLLLLLKIIKNSDIVVLNNNETDGSVLTVETLYSYFYRFISFLLVHIEDVFKRVRSKDYCQSVQFFSENEFFQKIGRNLVIYDFEAMFDLVFLTCRTIILNPSNTEVSAELNIDLNILSQDIKRLFGVMFQYLLINLKSYQSEIFSKIHSCYTLEQLLTFSFLLLDHVVGKKFTEENEGYDFCSIFTTFFDFANYFYSILRMNVVERISDFFHVVDGIEGFNLQKFENYYIPPYLVAAHNTKMKEFLYNHLLAINFNENIYECVTRNFWLTLFVDLYGFVDFLERLYRILVDFLSCEKNLTQKIVLMSVSYNIVDRVLGVFNDYFTKRFKSILPKKFILFKETYTAIYLYLFHHFIHSKKFKTYLDYSNMKYTPLLEMIEQISLTWNRKYFLLCNNILKAFKGESHRKKVRIYPNESFVMAYYEYSDQSTMVDFDIQLGSKENTDNNIIETSTVKRKRELGSAKFDITGISMNSLNCYKGISISKCKKSGKSYLRLKDLPCAVIITQDSEGGISFEELTAKSIKEILYNDIVNRSDYEFLVTNEHSDDEFINNFKATFRFYDLNGTMTYDSVVESLMIVLDLP